MIVKYWSCIYLIWSYFQNKSDAVKTIDEYGKYFYDKSLWEANLRKLKGLAFIRNKKDNNFELANNAVKEFLRAKIIFQKHNCNHGVAICCSGIGFILYEIFTHYVRNRTALLKYAKKTFVESLINYEAINHTYGMSYCYDMLQDIKRSIKEDFSTEYRNYLLLQQKVREDAENGKSKFIERIQGAEMSLFIENIFNVDVSFIESHYKGDNADDLAKVILERKKYIETLEKENRNQTKDFVDNIIGLITDENVEGGIHGTNIALIELGPQEAQDYINQAGKCMTTRI